MDVANEIREGLQRLVDYNRKTILIPAKVTALNEVEATIDVIDQDDIEIFDVRLRASVNDSTDGVTVYPSVGSWVLIVNLGGSAIEYAVIATTEVDRVLVKIDDTTIDADAQGVQMAFGNANVAIDTNGIGVQRGGENLKSVLNDLLTAITQLTVTCAAPGSPSTPPINLASFTALQTRVNNLLK